MPIILNILLFTLILDIKNCLNINQFIGSNNLKNNSNELQTRTNRDDGWFKADREMYCLDIESLKEGQFKLRGDRIIFIFEHKEYKKTYYSLAKRVKNGLPIIKLDLYPTIYVQHEDDKDDHTYIAEDYLFKEKVKHGSYRIVGFNQVWVGCPQPLCLDSEIDAIMKMGSHEQAAVFVFRGHYIWSLEKFNTEPSLEQTSIISKVFHSKEGDSPKSVDAAFYDGNMIHLFKHPFLWIGTIGKLEKMMISAKFQDIEEKIDAASYSHNLKDKITLFQNDHVFEYIRDKNTNQWRAKHPRKIERLHPDFPSYVDAVEMNFMERTYVFKGWFLYEFHKEMKRVNVKYAFQEFFNCPDSFYAKTKFKSYANFKELVLNKLKSYQLNPEYMKNRSKGKDYPINLKMVIVMISLIILCAVLIVVAVKFLKFDIKSPGNVEGNQKNENKKDEFDPKMRTSNSSITKSGSTALASPNEKERSPQAASPSLSTYFQHDSLSSKSNLSYLLETGLNSKKSDKNKLNTKSEHFEPKIENQFKYFKTFKKLNEHPTKFGPNSDHILNNQNKTSLNQEVYPIHYLVNNELKQETHLLTGKHHPHHHHQLKRSSTLKKLIKKPKLPLQVVSDNHFQKYI